jgi:excisionase family DNA binding protein
MNLIPDIFTVEQLAELMGCTTETIEEHTRKNLLPGIKWGRSWRYPRAATMVQLNELARQQLVKVSDGVPEGTVVPLRGRRRKPPEL